jgi:hypothetical protein
VANFQVHLESLSGKRKKERKRKPMKTLQWPRARMKGLHHHQHPRQMASMCLQQHLQPRLPRQVHPS